MTGADDRVGAASAAPLPEPLHLTEVGFTAELLATVDRLAELQHVDRAEMIRRLAEHGVSVETYRGMAPLDLQHPAWCDALHIGSLHSSISRWVTNTPVAITVLITHNERETNKPRIRLELDSANASFQVALPFSDAANLATALQELIDQATAEE